MEPQKGCYSVSINGGLAAWIPILSNRFPGYLFAEAENFQRLEEQIRAGLELHFRDLKNCGNWGLVKLDPVSGTSLGIAQADCAKIYGTLFSQIAINDSGTNNKPKGFVRFKIANHYITLPEEKQAPLKPELLAALFDVIQSYMKEDSRFNDTSSRQGVVSEMLTRTFAGATEW